MRDDALFSTGGIYHVYNRGVDRRSIFQDDADRIRFMKGLVLFNEHGRHAGNSIKTVSRVRQSEDPCVELMAYCLMPNHFHFMAKQVVNGGISEFMQRVGNGYTKYFNARHERQGRLLSGPYQVKRVETTGYLRHLSRYIHLNPLELDAAWNTGTRTWDDARAALERYQWSSFRHYAGLEWIPFVRDEEVMGHFENREGYVQFLRGFVASDCTEQDRSAADIEIPQLPTPGVGSWGMR